MSKIVTNNLILSLSAIGHILIVVFFINIIRKLYTFFSSKKQIEFKLKTLIQSFISGGIITLSAVVFIFQTPKVFFKVSWNELMNINDGNYKILLMTLIALVCTYYIYYLVEVSFINSKEISYVFISTLGIVSASAYAFITFLVNCVINKVTPVTMNLSILFFVSLLMYISTLKVVRVKLTGLTNMYIYNKRNHIIEKLSEIKYEEFEKIGGENIYTCINNDTEVISGFINIIVSGLSSLTVVIACCIYLAILNISLFMISIVVVAFIFAIIMIISAKSNSKWEESRENQEKFYSYFDGFIKGFKELYLKKKKIHEYKETIQKANKMYSHSRIGAEVYFAYVAFAIEGLIFAFAGFLILVLPQIAAFTLEDVTQFILVFLMLKGHFDVLLNAVPKLSQMQTSRKKIESLIKDSLDKYAVLNTTATLNVDYDKVSLKLENVEYHYKNSYDNKFKLGPINLTFNSGEITFIVGGNGSGKSTLGKVITGLYEPDKGTILVNGNIYKNNIGELYTAIFCDNYLFDTIYGVNMNGREKKVSELIEKMGLIGKTDIIDKKITNINLSTGQRKRVALLVSYLEDAPIYFFDEWAAEQDPEFKEYFYRNIIPELRNRGKCVIAITHDDRYFDLADNVIKLEYGQLIHN